jgi:hypothetical protein
LPVEQLKAIIAQYPNDDYVSQEEPKNMACLQLYNEFRFSKMETSLKAYAAPAKLLRAKRRHADAIKMVDKIYLDSHCESCEERRILLK